MKWGYYDVIDYGLPCSVCGHIVKEDIFYYPTNFNEEQGDWIATIWRCDPYSDFVVCENCMEGHGGLGYPSLNANNWLERKIVEFKNKKDAKQEQPTIPEKTEEPKLTDDSKSGFKKVDESRKESKMTNLTSDINVKETIKFGESYEDRWKIWWRTDNGELTVGKTGNVKANVKVRSAVIGGRMDGNIKASDKVELKQKAHLIGDLQAKTLVIEEGVVFVGQCNVNPEGTKIESQSYKEGIKEEIKEQRLNV